jgi:starch-binding outer membrane protein, SusD/RagB family
MTVHMQHAHSVARGASRLRTLLGGAARAAAAVLAAGAFAACSLETTQPDVAQPETLTPPEALKTIAAGGVADFAGAYGGFGNATEGLILISGLLGDEYIQSDYFEEHAQLENRNVLNTNYAIDSLVRTIQRSRKSNEAVAQRYTDLQVVDAGQARALNLAAFSYIFLAENYCGSIPLSTYDEAGHITFGPQIPAAQVLDTAIARFDAAIAVAQGITDDDGSAAEQVNVANVGKARALVDRGRYAEAAALVADVPTDFNYTVEYSTNTDRQRLGAYDWSASQSRFSLADMDGINGLPYRSANDPRLPYEDAGLSVTDGTTELFLEKKYGAPNANVPLATGIEARLIEAEAALQAGDAAAFRNKLNEARSQFDGLDPLSAGDIPASTEGRVALLFYERGFDLALTAHRLGDMRREARQATADLSGYGVGVENVFPVGETPKGSTFGDYVALPMPLVEANNPNFNAGQCDATVP